MAAHPGLDGMTEHAGQSAPSGDADWRRLGAPPQELQLDFCLPTGQSFRWRKTGDNQYTGVIGSRLVCLRQDPDDVLYRVLARGVDAPASADAAVLRDYFNLDTLLANLAAEWADSCGRFRDVSPHFPGARMLRQDPLECLFQFICSSNNHISRIHGMVERLCSSYGTPLQPTLSELGPGPLSPEGNGAAGPLPASGQAKGADGPAAVKQARKAKSAEADQTKALPGGGSTLSYYAFPTLVQLGHATEEELRAAGFGYRARFIVGTTAALLAKPGGGREWLLGLRQVGLQEAAEALTELPGIGPKVAACICLFSLDKHAAIPVDTHVWQIAVRYYCPQLRGKSLTKKVHAEVQRVFVDRFGAYAGWAHNTLFISELASQQHRLPEHLRQGKSGPGAGTGSRRGRGGGPEVSSEAGDGGEEDAKEVEAAAASPSRSASGSDTDRDDGDEVVAATCGVSGGQGAVPLRQGRRAVTGRAVTPGSKAGSSKAGSSKQQGGQQQGGSQQGGQQQGGQKRHPRGRRKDQGCGDGKEPDQADVRDAPAEASTPVLQRRGIKRREAAPLAPVKRVGGQGAAGDGAGGRREGPAVALDYGMADFDDLGS